jgi:hypothetical protein
LRKLVALSLIVLAGVVTNTAQARSNATNKLIENYISQTWQKQALTGKHITPTSRSYERTQSDRYRHWVLEYWKEEQQQANRLFQNPPHKTQWLCIHRYEGSWSDPSGPYYGGLQMDISFQRHYGGWLLAHKGTAEHWSVLEQMWVAERAFSSGRGFYPWPNTARYCNLI